MISYGLAVADGKRKYHTMIQIVRNESEKECKKVSIQFICCQTALI